MPGPIRAFYVAMVLLVVISLNSPQVWAPPSRAQPVWVTLNAAPQGNYPGGDQLFTIFVVNSATIATQNATVDNMTLTASWGASNTAIGLPAVLTPGQSLLATIYLPIPANFTDKSFTANLVVNLRVMNSSGVTPLKATGTATVYVLALPGAQPSQGTTQTVNAVPLTIFALVVAVPSVMALLLLVLLLRVRSRRAQAAVGPPQA